jgi:cyclopropane-fatty-acyl-phospholipid synthase
LQIGLAAWPKCHVDFGAKVTGGPCRPLVGICQRAHEMERQVEQADLRLQDYRDIQDGPYDAVFD